MKYVTDRAEGRDSSSRSRASPAWHANADHGGELGLIY
jgi:hypothetical protein